MLPVRAIFFDIGDTLVFDKPDMTERFWWATQACGIEYNKDDLSHGLRKAEDYVLEHYIHGIALSDPRLLREGAARWLIALGVVDRLDDEAWEKLLETYKAIEFQRMLHPDAIPLILELKSRGFKIGVISDWEDSLAALLEEMTLQHHLDALAVSAVVGCTKPDPRLFREGLRQVNVPAPEALHVGDFYELDVAGAFEARMQALLYDWREREPDAECPRVTTFGELQNYLLSLPAPIFMNM